MRDIDLAGADRMRQSARVMVAVKEKLQALEREVGIASVIHITCRVSGGQIHVTVQTTFD